jgi:4-nitrophenyl phosphatase
LDGTLYKEDHPLPGAVALLTHLQAIGQRFGCLSNSTQSPQRVVGRLRSMGVEMAADQILTAAEAAAEYCLDNFAPLPRIFNLATEGVAELLEGKVHWVQNENEPCDAVLIGSPVSLWATLARQRMALRLLCGGARCVGLCADRRYPSPDGLEIGSGAMTSMMAYAAGAQPVFVGKPEGRFFLTLCRHLAAPPDECLLVGDNLESDIAGAKRVGMRTILSLTGVAGRGDVASAPPDLQPDWIVQTLEELL